MSDIDDLKKAVLREPTVTRKVVKLINDFCERVEEAAAVGQLDTLLAVLRANANVLAASMSNGDVEKEKPAPEEPDEDAKPAPRARKK